MTDTGSFPVHVHGDLASLFSHSSVPLSFVGSVLCGCSGCERAFPESVTGMLATSSPGYIKPYWCASKMLPKLADDADAAKAVGGDRCYLSSPAASSQIVPSNKAINLIDKHISCIATFMLQLEDVYWGLPVKKMERKPVWESSFSQTCSLLMNILLYLCVLSLSCLLVRPWQTVEYYVFCILFVRLRFEYNHVGSIRK